MFRRFGVVIVAAVLLATLPGIVTPQHVKAAASLTSVEITNIVSGGGDCSPGSALLSSYDVVVTGVAEVPAGTFNVTAHLSGVNDTLAESWGSYSDSQLGTGLGGFLFNGTGWTAPGDTPTFYFTAESNGITVQSPILTYYCSSGTFSYQPGGSGGGGGGSGAEPVPGPDMVEIPEGSVVGTFTQNTALLWMPDASAISPNVMAIGQSLWVTGLDESGEFYQVLLSGRFYWVPAGSIGPTYDDVWNGAPLPTTVIE